MDESALRQRLDAIDRRQSLVLWLLVGLYPLGGAWLLVGELGVLSIWTVGAVGVLLAVLAVALGIVRRRRARAR